MKIIGNIQHGEKYTNKQGEEKWKNTDLGTLWKDEEKGEYVVKYLGQWCKVWPIKANNKDYQEARDAVQDDIDQDIPF